MNNGKSAIKRKYGLKVRSRLKKDGGRNNRSTQSGGRQRIENTHRCGSFYSTVLDVLLWPFKIFKKFLGTIGVTSYIEDIARENRDYILLFHIIMFLVVLGLLYFIFRMILGGSLGVDMAYISTFLKTMDSFDLPISETVNAIAERDALDCWSRYFSSNPLNFNNSGLFDVVRSMVLLPFFVLFLYPILPMLIVIYVTWFIWHYIGYIIDAIVGLVKASVWYFTEYIVCQVSGPIPFWSYRCPDFGETFTDWRKEYIDEPTYKERLKYFKILYRNKWNYWDRAKLYLENFWRRGRVQNKYNGKFFVRSKEVFYTKALDLTTKVDKKLDRTKGIAIETIDRVKSGLPSVGLPKNMDGQEYLKKTKDDVVRVYKNRQILYSILSLVALLVLVIILFGYGLTGKPIGIFEYIGPLWRSKGVGDRLELLSSRYNWLGIIGIAFVLIYLVVPW